MNDEAARLAQTFMQRDSDASVVDRYGRLRPDVQRRAAEIAAATGSALERAGLRPFAGRRVLDVGCGGGELLRRLLDLGFSASNLFGADLSPGRIEAARAALPRLITVFEGDASRLDVPDASFDAILAVTVFSSILDDRLATELAANMWRMTRPGGGILLIDITIGSPHNALVRAVRASDLDRLFPAGTRRTRRAVLAPPLARRTAAVPVLYELLRSVPWLRSHAISWVAKA